MFNTAKRVMQIYKTKVVRLSLRAQLFGMLVFALMLMLRGQLAEIVSTLDIPLLSRAYETMLLGGPFGNSGVFWLVVQALLFLFSWSAIATIATRVAYGVSVLVKLVGYWSNCLFYKILFRSACLGGRVFINLKDKRQEYQVYLQ